MALDVYLSIVIPVYRGEHSVGRLVDTLIDTLDVGRLQIVLVNDCSPDNSHKVCQEAQLRHPDHVTYVQLARNKGEHNAVMAGLNFVDGDYVVIMDDDFQNPPSEVPKLVRTAVEGGYDVVYSYYQEKKHSWFRNAGSRFNDRVASLLLDKPADLYLSSFKCMNRFLIDEVVKYTGPFPYVDGLVLRATSNIGRVETDHAEREDGVSGYTLRKLVRLWMNMFVNFSIMPLRLSVLFGMLFSLLGLLMAFFVVVDKVVNPDVPLGWTSLFMGLLVFSGVQLIILGLVGEYVGRLYLTLNQTPQFSIRKVWRKGR